MSPSETATQAQPGVEARQNAIAALARARAECLASGISPEQLTDLLLDEAMLAWLVADWPERKVRERLMRAVSEDVRNWFARARVATGQCDCVQEVHLAALLESEAQNRPPEDRPFHVTTPALAPRQARSQPRPGA